MAISVADVLKLKHDRPEHAQACRELLIVGLSRQERTIYDLCAGDGIDTRSAYVLLKMDSANAVTIMKSLRRKELVARKKSHVTGAVRKMYVYTQIVEAK